MTRTRINRYKVINKNTKKGENMNSLSKQIIDDLNTEGQFMTFSIRISKQHYDILQELGDVMGKKPGTIARACLQAAVEDLYGTLLTGPES